MKVLLFVQIINGLVNSCPSECRCESRDRVYCNNRGFKEIPAGIPLRTKVLHLQDNSLVSSNRLDEELEKLVYLERVMLYSNRLERVPKFRSTSLRELRLNSNRISKIDQDIFQDISSLSELILDDNKLTTIGIEEGAFSGIYQLTRISLMNNDLTEFPMHLPESLINLYLSQNQISFVSKKSLQPMLNLELLYMDRNKLSDGSFEVNALTQLKNLKHFELGSNFLTGIPTGISPNLEKLHLTANQLVYIRTDQLENFKTLDSLDFAYNRIKSIEEDALKHLEGLMRLELNNNDWKCDCYLKSLKAFLSRNRNLSHGMDQITCGDQINFGRKLNQVANEALSCKVPNFSAFQDESNILVKMDSTLISDTPPFAQYVVQYGSIDANVTNTSQMRPMEQRAIPLENSGSYKFCIFHDRQAGLPDKRCKTVEFKGQETISTEIPELETEIIIFKNNELNFQMIVAIVSIALGFIILSLLIAGIIWRRRKFQNLKNLTINTLENNGESYCSKLTNVSPTQMQHDLTMDASKEFAVTLMLRAPPVYDHTTLRPVSNQFSSDQYHSESTDQSSLPYDSSYHGSNNRNDSSLYI